MLKVYLDALENLPWCKNNVEIDMTHFKHQEYKFKDGKHLMLHNSAFFVIIGM